MNTMLQKTSIANKLPQDPLLAALMTNTQQTSKAGSLPFSENSFAELLKNFFVGATDRNGIGINQANSSNKKSGLTTPAEIFENKSVPSSDSKIENTDDKQKDNLIYSNLASLIFSMIQQTPAVKISNMRNVQDGSALNISQPMIEQRLANLMTTSQNPIDGIVLDSNQSNTLSTDPFSKLIGSGRDFLSMLSKKASENPVVKENLLKFLSDAPNSSVNRSTSAEIEKILSEFSGTEQKSNRVISQADVLQKLSTSDVQVQENLQKLETPAEISVKTSAAGNLHSTPGTKSLENASVAQSVVSSTNPAAKLFVTHDNQVIQGNASSASEKGTGKISAAAGKDGSSKSDYGSANLIKQNGTEIYQGISADSKIDSRFKQELATAVESNRDLISSKPDASQVAQTIIREAKMMTQENKTVVNVKLEPESLGSVILKVASDNGKLSAEFNVKTPDAQLYLENSIPQMKQMLQSNGISLTHLSVSLSGGESQAKQQQSPARRNSHKFSPEVESETADAVRTFGYNTMEVKV